MFPLHGTSSNICKDISLEDKNANMLVALEEKSDHHQR